MPAWLVQRKVSEVTLFSAYTEPVEKSQRAKPSKKVKALLEPGHDLLAPLQYEFPFIKVVRLSVRAQFLLLLIEFNGRKSTPELELIKQRPLNSNVHGFLNSPITAISEYVPRSKFKFLDRDLMAFVTRNPRLRKLSFELFELGKGRVGDVIQMTSQEVMDATGATEAAIAELEKWLSPCGLRLGMRVVGWKTSPVYRGCQL